MAKIAKKYLEVNPWIITEKGFHPERSRVSEAIFSLGNEYMGVRGYFDEGYGGDRLVGSYFNGIYSETDINHPIKFKGVPEIWHFMVSAVDWLYTRIELDGELLDLNQSKVSDFERTLDMKTGTLTRQFIWHTQSGKQLKITFTRFLSMTSVQVGFQRIVLEALNFSGPVQVTSALDFSPVHEEIHNRSYWTVEKTEHRGDFWFALGKTETVEQHLVSSFSLTADCEYVSKDIKDDKLFGTQLEISLEQGRMVTLDKRVCNHADKKRGSDGDSVWEAGVALAETFRELTFDAVLAEHAEYWEKLWKRTDVVVEGDDADQQGIRFCIFQLHQTNHGQDPSSNVGAKGLTGEIYGGKTFWDTESYCLPFFIFNNPQAAKNMLMFRYNTLPQALRIAESRDCKGATYPMESLNGDDSCVVWWHGNLEIHINAAVIYGIEQYRRLCDDDEFFYDYGMEIILQVCRFYASRGNWRPDGFGFYGVMGPDEMHTFINNNCYTNTMAKKGFELALAEIEKMKAEMPEKLLKLTDKISLASEELDEWRKIADKMIIPKDETTGLFEQHEGFFKLPHYDIDSISQEEIPIEHNWAQTKRYRYDMIKQPDVLLFLFLHSSEYSDAVKKINYEYYTPRCMHESSLSPSIHSILAAELGKHEEASAFYAYATRLDLDDYNRNTHQGLHMTSMAGAWLNVIYGFGGMRCDGDQLAFKPSMPKKWDSLSFRILYKGSTLCVKMDKKNITLSIDQDEPLAVEVFGKSIELTRQETSIPMPADRCA